MIGNCGPELFTEQRRPALLRRYIHSVFVVLSFHTDKYTIEYQTQQCTQKPPNKLEVKNIFT
jgi:hypothetical protein